MIVLSSAFLVCCRVGSIRVSSVNSNFQLRKTFLKCFLVSYPIKWNIKNFTFVAILLLLNDIIGDISAFSVEPFTAFSCGLGPAQAHTMRAARLKAGLHGASWRASQPADCR